MGIKKESMAKKGIAITDLVVRLGAAAAALGAVVTMGTAEQILPFFTQFFQFHAQYNDLPTFTFFVYAQGFVAGYVGVSILLSVVGILRPHAVGPRLTLLILDTAALTLSSASAGAATAIVYLGHKGSASANWLAVCLQFTNFCQATSGAVISSFVGVLFFLIMVALSACAF